MFTSKVRENVAPTIYLENPIIHTRSSRDTKPLSLAIILVEFGSWVTRSTRKDGIC